MLGNKHNSLSLVLGAHIRTGTEGHVPVIPALLRGVGGRGGRISRSFPLVNLRDAELIDKKDHAQSKMEGSDQHLRFSSDLHTLCGTSRCVPVPRHSVSSPIG